MTDLDRLASEDTDAALWDEVTREVAEETDDQQDALEGAPEQPAEAAEPEQEEAKAEEAAPSPEDLRAQLEALQRERDEWRHRYQSDQGRFMAAQRALQEAAQTRKQSGGNEPGSQAEIAQAGVEALKAGRFEEFSQEYPEMAEAISEFYKVREQQILSTLQAELAPLKEAYQRQAQFEEQAAFDRAVQDLTARHPDWQQYDINSNADFRDWLSAQPAEMQSLYGKPNAYAASRLIDFYKADRQIARAPAPGSDRAEKLQQQRQAKLERQSLPPTRTTSVSADADPDSALWNSIVKQVERQRRL